MSVDRDIIENLQKRIADLEQQMKSVRAISTPTLPSYDSAQFPLDAVEGQIAIADGTAFAPSSGVSGIFYDVSNVGGDLHIGAAEIDFTVGPSGGVSYTVTNGSYSYRGINTLLTSDYDVDVDDTLIFNARNGSFDLTTGTDVDIEAGTNINLWAQGGPLFLQGTPNVQVALLTSQFFNVKNNASADIFRIDESGQVHIKTGTTIHADL